MRWQELSCGDAKTVERQTDVLGKGAFGFFVRKVVADVREENFARFDSAPSFHGSRDGHVRGVGAVAKAVHDEPFRTSRRLLRLGRDRAAVGHISEAFPSILRKDVAGGVEATVRKLHRHNVEVADLERAGDFMRDGANVVSALRAAVEGKLKDPAQVGHHAGRGVDRNIAPVELAESTQIVEAHDVIGVRMRVEDGVDLVDPLAQALGAKIRRGIDHNPHSRGANENRGAQSIVAGVFRSAHGTFAADHGDPVRGAGAEKGDFEFRRCFHFEGEAVIFRLAAAMLASLRIRNFALVDLLEWTVPAGFVAITGETGAGKSILIGGLQLLLGDRADKSAIRTGEKECAIEAAFVLDRKSPVHGILEEAGVDPCEDGQLLVKRIISATGAGRQFVNGSPCTLALLKRIGDCLVDLHGSHDHQSLFATEAQIRLLDAFAGIEETVNEYRRARSEWLALENERNEADDAARSREREIDLLEHQTAEIAEAALQEDEEETLVAKHQVAANAQKLKQLAASAAQLLAGDEDSIQSRMAEAARLLREISRLDESQSALVDRHAALAEELDELSNMVSSYGERIDADPQVLATIEERLDLIQNLKRKYGTTLAEVIHYGREAETRLAELRRQVERREGLDEQIAAAREKTLNLGAKVSAARKAAGPKLAASVRRHLKDLGFLKAGFEIELTACESGPDGLETVEFVFAPNPGEPAKPLRAIASSGEISRVMLALKTSLAAQDDVPVLVFDEIDANVGGEVAHAVGQKMREIGECRQVLCITHLPQVASSAGAHFVVEKSVSGGRTSSRLTEVEKAEREKEIARMLGSRSGEAALAHARELLGA